MFEGPGTVMPCGPLNIRQVDLISAGRTVLCGSLACGIDNLASVRTLHPEAGPEITHMWPYQFCTFSRLRKTDHVKFDAHPDSAD